MKKISLIIIIITFTNYIIYSHYHNQIITNITNTIIENNPEINKQDIAKILKNPQKTTYNHLEQYGYNNHQINHQILIINIIINIIISFPIIMIVIIIDKRKKQKNQSELNELISIVENINKGNYKINLNKYTETDFSKLYNSIYKTTVILKEHEEFLIKDRIILKENVENISHQLKTPLTSINLMLETIIDDENMEEKLKHQFLMKIQTQIDKINYLVQTLLKISKLETSTIKFTKEKVNIKTLLTNVITNLKPIATNTKINLITADDIKLICDPKWQSEALTNIIKNCIEHSNEITIKVEDNNFYTIITIQDNGIGINEKDLKHIFTRHYLSQNSSGSGIGLNLAQTIIKKDNGTISVKSIENNYTIFKIKYLKGIL